MTRSPRMQTSGRSCRVYERSRSRGQWPLRPRLCHAPQGVSWVPAERCCCAVGLVPGLGAVPLHHGHPLLWPQQDSRVLLRPAPYAASEVRPPPGQGPSKLHPGPLGRRSPCGCYHGRKLRAESSRADPGAAHRPRSPASLSCSLWVGRQGCACREGAGELACPPPTP